MFRQERDDPRAVQDAVSDGSAPVVAKLDLALVNPDIVAASFEIVPDTLDENRVVVVAVAKEDF